MANFDLTVRAEGDDFNATSIKQPFSDLSTAVNDLEYEAIEREALRGDIHLASLVPAAAFSTDLTRTGYHAAGAYNIYLSNASPPNYQQFGTQAPVANYGSAAPYGRPSVADVGWRIINGLTTAPTNSAPAEVRLASASTLAGINLSGALLSGSVQVAQSNNAPLDAENKTADGDRCLLLAIGFEDSGGTRHIIERSIRWYSLNATEFGSAETTAYVTQTDLDALGGANTQVAAFFLAVSGRRRRGAGLTSSYQTAIGQYHFSVLPIRAGALIPV